MWTCGKGVYAEPVAELALTLALAGLRDLGLYARASTWSRPSGRNLFEANVTILGGGGITASLLRLLRPFDCHVTVVRNRVQHMDGADEVLESDRYVDALPGADVVVLALALTSETEGIIARGELESMERHAWLVNVARGKHVVTDDLVDGRCGKARSAAPGSTSPIPSRCPTDHPLWTMPNCIITPHVGNTPEMAVPLLSERITANVRRYAYGCRADRLGPPRSRVLSARMVTDRVPDAATIVGLLADDDRRAVVAALVLGSTTLDQIARRDRSRPAGGRQGVGPTGRAPDSSSRVPGVASTSLAEAFRHAARTAHQNAAPAADEHEGASARGGEGDAGVRGATAG